MKKKLNVAMIGYQFMGRAHSNAWRQVNRFFDPPFEPVMTLYPDGTSKRPGACSSLGSGSCCSSSGGRSAGISVMSSPR